MVLSEGLRSEKGPAAPPYSNGPYEWDQAVVMQKPVVDSYKRYTLEEHFEKIPQINTTIDQVYTTEAARVCNTSFEVLGTSVADANINFASTIGGIEVKTAGTSGNQAIVVPHLDTEYTAWTGVKWGTENQVIWEAVIRTGASVADVILWAGLKLTNDQDPATDLDSVFFRFTSASDTYWICMYSINNSDSTITTNVAVAIDTNYYFRIELDSDRKAHFFINNKEVGMSSALRDDIDLIPYIGVETLTSGAKIVNVVKQKISRILFE